MNLQTASIPIPVGSKIGFLGGVIWFWVMPAGGNIEEKSLAGHYIDLRTDKAQIIAVDDFRGEAAYADIVPGFKVDKIEPLPSDDPAAERFMAIYLVRI